ncbi:unnamed protein product, partial [Allacma fusca]
FKGDGKEQCYKVPVPCEDVWEVQKGPVAFENICIRLPQFLLHSSIQSCLYKSHHENISLGPMLEGQMRMLELRACTLDQDIFLCIFLLSVESRVQGSQRLVGISEAELIENYFNRLKWKHHWRD